MEYRVSLEVQHAVDMEIARALGYLSANTGNGSPLGDRTREHGKNILAALQAAADLQRKQRKINADR